MDASHKNAVLLSKNIYNLPKILQIWFFYITEYRLYTCVYRRRARCSTNDVFRVFSTISFGIVLCTMNLHWHITHHKKEYCLLITMILKWKEINCKEFVVQYVKRDNYTTMLFIANVCLNILFLHGCGLIALSFIPTCSFHVRLSVSHRMCTCGFRQLVAWSPWWQWLTVTLATIHGNCR